MEGYNWNIAIFCLLMVIISPLLAYPSKDEARERGNAVGESEDGTGKTTFVVPSTSEIHFAIQGGSTPDGHLVDKHVRLLELYARILQQMANRDRLNHKFAVMERKFYSLDNVKLRLEQMEQELRETKRMVQACKTRHHSESTLRSLESLDSEEAASISSESEIFIQRGLAESEKSFPFDDEDFSEESSGNGSGESDEFGVDLESGDIPITDYFAPREFSEFKIRLQKQEKLLQEQAKYSRNLYGIVQQQQQRMAANRESGINQAEMLEDHLRQYAVIESQIEIQTAKIETLSIDMKWYEFNLESMNNDTKLLRNEIIDMEHAMSGVYVKRAEMMSKIEDIDEEMKNCQSTLEDVQSKYSIFSNLLQICKDNQNTNKPSVNKFLDLVDKCSNEVSSGKTEFESYLSLVPYLNATTSDLLDDTLEQRDQLDLLSLDVEELKDELSVTNTEVDALKGNMFKLKGREQREIKSQTVVIKKLRKMQQELRLLQSQVKGEVTVSMETENDIANIATASDDDHSSEEEEEEEAVQISVDAAELSSKEEKHHDKKIPKAMHLNVTTRGKLDKKASPRSRDSFPRKSSSTETGDSSEQKTSSIPPSQFLEPKLNSSMVLTTASQPTELPRLTSSAETETVIGTDFEDQDSEPEAEEFLPAKAPTTTDRQHVGCEIIGTENPKLLRTIYKTTTGAWMKDPEATDGLIYVLKGTHRVDHIRVYKSEEALAANHIEKIIRLPFRCTGTGHVIYMGSFYCNKFMTNKIIKYDMQTKDVTSLQLKSAVYSNEGPYSIGAFTDIDLAVDEEGLWVIYTSRQNHGKIVIAKLDPEILQVRQEWSTNHLKREAGNTFMVCGKLYAVVYSQKKPAEVDYVYDTKTNSVVNLPKEKILLNSYTEYQTMLDYNPHDRKLYSWNLSRSWNGQLVTYDIVFNKKNR